MNHDFFANPNREQAVALPHVFAHNITIDADSRWRHVRRAAVAHFLAFGFEGFMDLGDSDNNIVDINDDELAKI